MEFYYHDVDKDVLILSADGGLCAETAERFVEELSRFVDLGMRKLIVDCTRLTYLSSYGMGILVRLHKRLALQGGDVKLAAVPGVVARVIRLVRLDGVFQIFPTVDAALRSFHDEPTTD
jgi:anti-sigma B factor antagonist